MWTFLRKATYAPFHHHSSDTHSMFFLLNSRFCIVLGTVMPSTAVVYLSLKTDTQTRHEDILCSSIVCINGILYSAYINSWWKLIHSQIHQRGGRISSTVKFTLLYNSRVQELLNIVESLQWIVLFLRIRAGCWLLLHHLILETALKEVQKLRICVKFLHASCLPPCIRCHIHQRLLDNNIHMLITMMWWYIWCGLFLREFSFHTMLRQFRVAGH